MYDILPSRIICTIMYYKHYNTHIADLDTKAVGHYPLYIQLPVQTFHNSHTPQTNFRSRQTLYYYFFQWLVSLNFNWTLIEGTHYSILWSVFHCDMQVCSLNWRLIRPVGINQYDITMATHYDITMGNDIARDAHCEIIMGDDVARDIGCDVTMSNEWCCYVYIHIMASQCIMTLLWTFSIMYSLLYVFYYG